MNSLLINKIITLQKEIYRDVYNESKWVYVKIQTLFEMISSTFLEESLRDKVSIDTQLSGLEMFDYLNKRYFDDAELTQIFKEINMRANVEKHSIQIDRITTNPYDKALIRKGFEKFNLYCNKLFGSDASSLLLDSAIIDSSQHFKVMQQNDKMKTRMTLQSYKEKANTDSEKTTFYYQINCGAGQQDFGFRIYGLPENPKCTNKAASIYSTIYGFILRSRVAKKPLFALNKEREGVRFQYSKLLRFQVIILLMIRSNYESNSVLLLNIEDKSDRIELELAADLIKDYAQKISLLSGIDIPPLEIRIDNTGHLISLSDNHNADIYVVDLMKAEKEESRELWFERPINYSVLDTVEHKKTMALLLEEFFGYASFKPGQYQALIRLLNSMDNSVCILPTGGGKSLIFYFICLLQPSPSLLVFPTQALIKDQVRNLIDLHQIDDVYVVSNLDCLEKGYFKPRNKFLMLTPSHYQHYYLLCRIIELNHLRMISSIILDEIHTISNWSHDFRPDYLMLAFNIITFADNPRLYGFTATANYRVLKDIRTQLRIHAYAVISPVKLERADISYEFKPVSDEEEIYGTCAEIIAEITAKMPYKNSKMLIFTKNIDQSCKIIDLFETDNEALYDIDIFNSFDNNSYEGFLRGRKSILIADSSMGIGINLPDINHVIHSGIPISKAQYVQEVGRANRFGDGACSVVVFKSKKHMTENEQKILNFNTSIDEILKIIQTLPPENDVACAFRNIIGHVEDSVTAAQHINSIFESIASVNNYILLEFPIGKSQPSQNRRHQTYLYFLHKMGIIYNWYIKNISADSTQYLIEVEGKKNNLAYVKQKSLNYVAQLSSNKKIFHQIEKATDVKNIILIVQEWYYNEFLYFHREQLLNVLDFYEMNSSFSMGQVNINEQLSEYFATAASAANSEEIIMLSNISMMEILEISRQKQWQQSLAKIEHHIENAYHIKLDIFIFLRQLYLNHHFNASRLERIVMQAPMSLWPDLVEVLTIVYADCNNEQKLKIIKVLLERENETFVIDKIYKKNSLDLIYYGYYAKLANQVISGMF